MYDNIRTWPIRVAQDKFVLGVIKALNVGLSEIYQRSENGITSEKAP